MIRLLVAELVSFYNLTFKKRIARLRQGSQQLGFLIAGFFSPAFIFLLILVANT